MPQPLHGDHLEMEHSSHQELIYSGRAATLSLSAPTRATRLFAYSFTFVASGGTGPYTFALHAGALPIGLSLSSSGVISGTGTEAFDPSVPPARIDSLKHYALTVRVTDAHGTTTDCRVDLPYQMAIHLTGSLSYGTGAIAANPSWVSLGWTLTTAVDVIVVLLTGHAHTGATANLFSYSPNYAGFHDTFYLEADSPGIWMAYADVYVTVDGAIDVPGLPYASAPQSGPLGTYSVELPAGVIDDTSHGGGLYPYAAASGSFVAG